MVSLACNVAVPAVGVAKRRNDEVVRTVVGDGGRQACNVVSVGGRGDEGDDNMLKLIPLLFQWSVF